MNKKKTAKIYDFRVTNFHLQFVHGGHTNKISDFGWNPAEPWMFSSTAEDNIVETWQIVSRVLCIK